MALSVGDQFPSGVKFTYIPYSPDLEGVTACGIPIAYDTEKEFPSKKVVIVSVPGAFTPTCTANHIPPFVEKIKDLKSKGADEIIVLSANDPFVQAAWGKALGGYKQLIFASDGNAAFSKAIGKSVDLSSKGFGIRTARYAIIVDHGKVTYIEQEPGPGVSVSGVDAILAHL
ncbi:uncharacterized protein SAPINGB_P004556 [Magnusiomyces paraingens]|uniref:Thioredoxin peroxidase n=1 Tax=Magnusiomyces paraingens TaxID=2606893 RepID=A0A5E8C0M0_9ASCO|nr:uncharacterized protein SAPINGB_P004556 [Saprochaete ingens]VVT55357.1 unnamed protein product [Saprochaete ingens]